MSSINFNNNPNSNLIISIIEIGDKPKLLQLLNDNLDPNIIIDTKRNFTPLHFAAGYQSIHQYEIVSLLLKQRGNPNFCAKDGTTPIHICVMWNHLRILHLLLSHDGNPLINDNDGKSALDLAREENLKDCVQIILFHLRLNYEKSIKLNLESDSTLCESLAISETSHSSYCSSELESLFPDLNLGFCSEESEVNKISSIDTSSSNTIIYGCDLESSPSDSSLSSTGSLYLTTQSELLTKQLAKIYKSIEGLSTGQIREELIQLGDNPGSINNDVKHNYLKKLARLKLDDHLKTPTKHNNLLAGYSDELCQILIKNLDFEEMRKLDHELSSDFGQPDPKKQWRDGTRKTCFNYLLMDPEITNNLPKQNIKMKFVEQFEVFIKSIFYVGKGQSNRPHEHLNAALKMYQSKSKVISKKLNRILEIWNKNLGVVCVRCFQNAIPTEALTREACMIDSLVLGNITNEKRGEIYGKAKQWTDKQRRKYGAYLLTRALHVYINDGERQIRPQDLKN